MRLIFEIRPDSVTVSLQEGRAVVGSRMLEDVRQLSKALLPVVDELMTGQGIVPADLAGIDVRSEVPQTYTSARIVGTTAEMLRSLARADTSPADRPTL